MKQIIHTPIKTTTPQTDFSIFLAGPSLRSNGEIITTPWRKKLIKKSIHNSKINNQ